MAKEASLDDFKEGGVLREYVKPTTLLDKIGNTDYDQDDLLINLCNSITNVGVLDAENNILIDVPESNDDDDDNGNDNGNDNGDDDKTEDPKEEVTEPEVTEPENGENPSNDNPGVNE